LGLLLTIRLKLGNPRKQMAFLMLGERRN